MISSKSILTAAHCLYKNYVLLDVDQVSISLGRRTLHANESSGQYFQVEFFCKYFNCVPISAGYISCQLNLSISRTSDGSPSQHIIFGDGALALSRM